MKRLGRGSPFGGWKRVSGLAMAIVLPVAASTELAVLSCASAAEKSLRSVRVQYEAAIGQGEAALGVTLADEPDGTVEVSGVMPNSPAAVAGIRPGDHIQAINESLISNSRDVIYLISSKPPGAKVTIRLDRSGLQGALRATLLSRREVNQRAALGITFSRATMHSVRVLAVVPNSPAAKAGIKLGDRIVSVNDEPVSSYEDVLRLIGDPRPGSAVRMKIDRDGLQGTLLATFEGGQQVYQAPRPFVLPPPPAPLNQDDLLFRNTPAQIDDQRSYGD